MKDKPIIQDAIGYSFKGLERYEFIEEIIKEFKLDSNRYWMRLAQEDDCWFTTGDYVVYQTEPTMLEEYDLTYDIPYNENNIEIVMFVEYLIDSMLSYIGYLEGCLLKEIDNKKGDTS